MANKPHPLDDAQQRLQAKTTNSRLRRRKKVLRRNRNLLICRKLFGGPKGIALKSAVKSKKKLDTVRQELVFTSSHNGKSVEEEDKNVVVVHGGGGGDLESMKECDWLENSIIVRSISGFGIDEHSVKQRWRLVQEETKNMMKDKLKALQAKEIDFVLQKTEFLHEVASMIFEASKNSSN